MSSDGYFEGEDDFDEAALAQIYAIEEANKDISKPHSNTKRIQSEDPYDDFSFNFNEVELRKLDLAIQDSYEDRIPTIGSSRTFARTPSSHMVQTTLFGGVAEQQISKPRPDMQRTTSTQRNIFGQQAKKTKQWDQTAFAKTGVRAPKSKDKGKGHSDVDDEPLEFEQFPAPFVSVGYDHWCIFVRPPPPMKLVPDLLEAKHWIYPINRPKRDYQFNIVKRCLFDNTLVALPTGLGKTFIAGVVMLNFYRWFPEGKVVFVAPTKPLVAQQVTACHETCGIPGKDGVELTGEVTRSARIRYWSEKRVFFMTPQTLINDLMKETCDARDIVLLVVDEAHRATGNYAYNQVIRFMMSKNPHFRVLALTATPGNDPQTVQTLIDGLHISRIEIRNEESLDLKPYIHKKIFVPHIIKANPAVARIRDLLANVMNPLMKPMRSTGILRPNESAVSLHPYRPQALMREIRNKSFLWPLAMLAKLARAMMYLLTGSIEACYQFLYDISNESNVDDSNKKKGRKLKDDPNFVILMQELEKQKAIGFALHPKMEGLLNILVQHFGQLDEGEETRVMVFSSYRAVVDRIVEELNKHEPLLRATRFIGQGTDKQGKKGLAQKEQHEVIHKFQSGVYNILVATSIGEEGLDIGEIDVTVCYDADKAPTRMIQRFGRTGRKRDGTVHALLSEEREESNIDKAESTYREVQKQITKGELYELYGDVKRLLPDHMKPGCIEKVVEIQQYVRERKSPKKKPTDSKAPKRKRNDDVMRNIPEGACTGFVSVRDLLVKKASPKPKKVKMSRDFDACGKDDETDEDIESGRVLAAPRPTQLESAIASSKQMASLTKKAKGKLQKSATMGSKPKKLRKKKPERSAASQFARQGSDDSDDMDMEQGAISKGCRRSDQNSRSPICILSDGSPFLQRRPIERQISLIPTSLPEPPASRPNIIELSDSERQSHLVKQGRRTPLPSLRSNNQADEDNMGWVVDDDDEDVLRIEIVDSSPRMPKRNKPRLGIWNEAPTTPRRTLPPESLDNFIGTIEPEQIQFSSPVSIRHTPNPTFPVRRVKRRRLIIEEDAENSHVEDNPPPLSQRLHRTELTPIKSRKRKRKKPRVKPTILGNGANPLFDGEAVHSGDDISQGESNADEDTENESDRQFIKDSPITQASQSYDQSQIYRRSLMSQFVDQTSVAGPMFARGPVRQKPFGRIEGRMNGRHGQMGGVLPSSSPPYPDEELDTYEYGSFVVADDDVGQVSLF